MALRAVGGTGAIFMPRILLIEDDIDLRDIIQEMLQAQGYEVSVAADGAQGYSIATKATSVAPDH
jgi:DNA-binding response OmpR family regulator